MTGVVDQARSMKRSLGFSRVLTSGWVAVLLIYAGSRLYSSALLAGMLALAKAQDWLFIGIRGKPGFVVFSGSWDGWFYRSIAESGYPVNVPTDAFGHVLPNPWAFLPVFPFLERVLSSASGMTTFAAGAVVATIAGAAAALVLRKLLCPHVGERRALWAVALFAFGPLAFLLQAAYAESVFLLLIFTALLLIERERYLTLIPIVLIAAFTRPGAIAIPAALVLQVGTTWLSSRHQPRHLPRILVAVATSTIACLAWPYIADLITGRPRTYLDTELSWWTGWVGRPDFIPFTPWFLITARWLGPVGVVLAVTLAAALLFWIVRRSPRQLGAPIRNFSVLYVLYLVAVFLPQFSLPRILMPLTPLLGSAAFTGTRRRRRNWLIAAAVLQPAGVALLWFLSYP